jgi:hypothetical protein
MKTETHYFTEAIKMRSKKILFVITVLLVTGVSVYAADVNWAPDANSIAAGEGFWSAGINWSTGNLPTTADQARISGAADCVLDFPTTTAGIVVGYGSNAGKFIVADGGSYTSNLNRWTGMQGQPGVVEIQRGGSIQVLSHWWNGLYDSSDGATLIINGGQMLIGEALDLGRDTDPAVGVPPSGYVKLNAGLLQARRFAADNQSAWYHGTSNSNLDIRFGTFIIDDGDQTAIVDTLIANGGITAFGGLGTVVRDYNITNSGKTTVTATDPLARTPEMNAIVPAGDVDLSWINLGTSPVGIAVYFGTDLDDLTMITDPNTAIDITTVTVSAPEFDEYIWRVDTYESTPGTDPNDPIVGDTMYFVASDDAPPQMIMDTLRTATWINEPTPIQVTVYDDGKSAVTITWSAQDTSGADAGPIADPNVIFDPPFTVIPAQASYTGTGIVVTTTMTVDYHAAQMSATATIEDSNPLGVTASASVNFDCANSACQAATAALNLDEVYIGDIAVDCKIDLNDFAMMASEWLADYSLTEPVPAP